MSFVDKRERAESLARHIEDTEAREELLGLLDKMQRAFNFCATMGKPRDPEPDELPAPADSLEALAQGWREEAETLRSAGANSLAKLSDRHATEVEAADGARRFDPLTLEEASEIGGYSYEHLQRLVADGKLANAGVKGSPRIYRRDVPRKPGHGSERPSRPKLSIVEDSIRQQREASNG